MGLIDKLNYLKETIDIMLPALNAARGGKSYSLRSKAEYLVNKTILHTADLDWTVRVKNNVPITDELTVEACTPEYIVHIAPGLYALGCASVNIPAYVSSDTKSNTPVDYIDFFSKKNVGENCIANIGGRSIVGASPHTINMPTNYRLYSRSIVLGSFCGAEHDANVLSRGLIWRNCRYCASDWLVWANVWPDYEVKVVCTAPIAVSTYFHNLRMSADTIVGIIDKLVDGATGALVLSIGAINLQKLTEAQLDIAYKKGWTVQ